MHPRIFFPRLFSAVAIFSLLAFAGCSSDRGRGKPRPITPMAGQETFFNGTLLAKVTVGNEGMPKGGPNGGAGGEGGRRGNGGGGRPPRGGGMGGGGGGFGGPPGGDSERGGGDAPSPMRMGSPGNPVLIRVSFTNQSNAPVELWINEFASPLGNFAVQPEKLVLAPQQTLEIEPMTSQLGGLYVEVDTRLALRIGDQSEKKVFHLAAAPKPPAP